MKKLIFLLCFSFSSGLLNAKSNLDIVPNIYLNTPEAISSTVEQLRMMPINRMEELIGSECNSLGNFINLSINNWEIARIGSKSEAEADNYEELLIRQVLGTQIKMLPFSFGLSTYSSIGEGIKEKFFIKKSGLGNNNSQEEFVNKGISFCKVKMAPEKYYELLNDSYYAKGSLKKPDLNSLEQIREKSSIKTLLPLNDQIPKDSKLTKSGIGKQLQFSDKDLNIAYLMILNDVRISMINQNQTWFVYQYIANRKFSQFKEFLVKGGRNEIFMQIISVVKMLDIMTNGFEGINTFNINQVEELSNKLAELTPQEQQKLSNQIKKKYSIN